MNNKKYIAIGIVVGLVVVAAVVLFLKFGGTAPTPSAPSSPSATQPSTTTQPPVEKYVPKDGAIMPVLPLESQADYIVDITPIGFSPDTFKVKRGKSVIWTSRDRYNNHQIVATGSQKYPEKGDCGTKMDACSPLKLGDSFRATFTVAGTWTYADKLNPKLTGTIIVE